MVGMGYVCMSVCMSSWSVVMVGMGYVCMSLCNVSMVGMVVMVCAVVMVGMVVVVGMVGMVVIDSVFREFAFVIFIANSSPQSMSSSRSSGSRRPG